MLLVLLLLATREAVRCCYTSSLLSQPGRAEQTGAGGYQQQQQYGSAQPTAQAGQASYGQQAGGYGASYQQQAQVHTDSTQSGTDGPCMRGMQRGKSAYQLRVRARRLVHPRLVAGVASALGIPPSSVCHPEQGWRKDTWLMHVRLMCSSCLQQGGYQAAGQQASAYGQRPGAGAAAPAATGYGQQAAAPAATGYGQQAAASAAAGYGQQAAAPAATAYGQQAAAGSTTAYAAQGSYGQVCGLV